MVANFFKFSTRSKTMELVAGLKEFTRMVAAVKLLKPCYKIGTSTATANGNSSEKKKKTKKNSNAKRTRRESQRHVLPETTESL